MQAELAQLLLIDGELTEAQIKILKGGSLSERRGELQEYIKQLEEDLVEIKKESEKIKSRASQLPPPTTFSKSSIQKLTSPGEVERQLELERLLLDPCFQVRTSKSFVFEKLKIKIKDVVRDGKTVKVPTIVRPINGRVTLIVTIPGQKKLILQQDLDYSPTDDEILSTVKGAFVQNKSDSKRIEEMISGASPWPTKEEWEKERSKKVAFKGFFGVSGESFIKNLSF